MCAALVASTNTPPTACKTTRNQKEGATGHRHEGEVVAVVCKDEGDGLAQGALLEIDIGVGVEEPLAARLLRADVQGVHLAEPSGGEVLYIYRSDSGVLTCNPLDDPSGPVG
jgi:hypothetical protein